MTMRVPELRITFVTWMYTNGVVHISEQDIEKQTKMIKEGIEVQAAAYSTLGSHSLRRIRKCWFIASNMILQNKAIEFVLIDF